MNIIASNCLFNNLENIKDVLYENPPLFQFKIGTNLSSLDYSSYKSFYTWKGTLKTIRVGRNGRRNVQDINPILINKIYQNQFFYKNNNKTYFDYLNNSVKEEENCPENYKRCGILDSNNNILCIPINEECPLNDLKISNIELPDLLSEYSYIKLTESLTDSIKYIYFTNKKINNKIIIHFELSTNNPCIVSDEHNWIAVSNKEKEKTCNCTTYINNNLYDPLYKEVGNNILLKSIYYDNNIPIFSECNTQTVNLYARNYYYLNKECVEKYVSDFDELEKSYTSAILTIRKLQYIDFVLIIIYIIFLFLYTFTEDDKFKNISLIITSIILIYEVIIYIIFIFSINDQKLQFNCGGETINLKIENIYSQIFPSKTKILFFSIINLILNFLNLILNSTLFFVKKE